MQRLTSGQELTSQNFSCSLDDGEQLKAGVCPHAYVVFLAIAAVDGVNTRWHGAHLVAGDDARRCVLDYHQTAVKTRVGGQERRQASGPAQELEDAALRHRTQLARGNLEVVEDDRKRLAVEIARTDDFPALRQQDGIVGHSGRFAFEGLDAQVDGFAHAPE